MKILFLLLKKTTIYLTFLLTIYILFYRLERTRATDTTYPWWTRLSCTWVHKLSRTFKTRVVQPQLPPSHILLTWTSSKTLLLISILKVRKFLIYFLRHFSNGFFMYYIVYINISTSWAQNSFQVLVNIIHFFISCLNYLILLITNTLNNFFFLFKQTHTGRYLYLNAIANQLRYPNSHTHYFSCTLLYLFAEANSEAIQEQITRYVKYVLYDEKKG